MGKPQPRRLSKQSARLKEAVWPRRSCYNCEYAKLDPRWGDYKCLKRHFYIYSDNIDCDLYKEAKNDGKR